jgi:hypothetical protein
MARALEGLRVIDADTHLTEALEPLDQAGA